MKYKTVQFVDGKLRLLDQTLLPNTISHVECSTCEEVIEAIKCMKVRGAPAIGVAAAYGMVLAINRNCKNHDRVLDELESSSFELRNSRPTAVNLQWAVDRMLRYAKKIDSNSFYEKMLAEANAIMEEDARSCLAIGEYGKKIVLKHTENSNVLTYCNAGSLATAGLGTALSPLYLAHEAGAKFSIYCCETRPLLQGARLTSWELQESGLSPILICDNMAAKVMGEKNRIGMVIVGADRIAANGDVANKIGTFGLAIAAKYHNIPFYVAAPFSTFDTKIENGEGIPIENRHPYEILYWKGEMISPALAYNPAFDITPAELITAIITDRGVISPVNKENIGKF